MGDLRNKNAEQKCGIKMRNKNVEQKLWNKKWWGPLDIGCWGPQVQVQKGQQNQNVEQKLVGTLGHRVLGTPSGSAKRSAEQKCGTKISGDPFALVLRVPITQCPMVPTNFYSTVFVPHFCSADLFALAPEVPNTQCPRVPTNFCSAIFVPHFCSTDLFALVFRVPITQCPMVPTNFYSTVLVPLFLFRCFCSTFLFH